MMKTSILCSSLALSLLVLSSCRGNSPIQKDSTEMTHDRPIDIQGHRGARWYLPENTIEGFIHALEGGADTLELDLNVTKDDVLVIHHDQSTNPELCKIEGLETKFKSQPIRSLNWNEIQKLDCGSQVNPRFPDQNLIPGAKIPRLEQLFEALEKSTHPRASKVRFNIETKSQESKPENQPAPRDYARLVVDVVEKFELSNRVCIQSFDHRTIVEVKKMAPQIRTAALFGEAPKDWIKAIRASQADIVSPRFSLLSKELIDKLHDNNLIVIPWTVNQEDDWKNLIEIGVDGIITDRPSDLAKFLKRRP